MEAAIALPLSAYEIERRKPMPSKNHGIIQTNITGLLYADYRKKFRIITELRIEIEGDDYTPDICIYPLMNFDSLHDEIRVKQVPLTAIEILSPTQGTEDLLEKFEVYFKAGIQSCWFVQPAMSTIFLLTPDKKIKVFHEEILTDPTNDISIDLQEVFQ